MAVTWNAMLPDVLPHVRGCSDPLAELEVKRAAQDFFERSRAWQVLLAAVAVSANQKEVTVTPSDSSQALVRVEAAWYDGKEVHPVTPRDLEDDGTDWQEETGTPERFLRLTPGIIRLWPYSTAAAISGVKTRVSVKPSESATGIPDDLAVKFRDALATGAKALLMLTPEQKFTNLNLGAALHEKFEAMIAQANWEASRAYGGGRVSSRPQWC